MIKRVSLLILGLLMMCSIAFADTPEPKKHIVLFFKSTDIILQVQNEEEDIDKGKIELEKELKTHYGKRFIVDDVRFMPLNKLHTPEEYLEMVKLTQAPFVVKIELGGEGTSLSTYQNAFGATATGAAPTVYVHLTELTQYKDDNNTYYYDYGTQSYGSGTMALGGLVYAIEKDPRKNTKNAVRGVFRDACKYNDKINKYANPAVYENELARFTGDFKKAAQIKKAAQAPLIAKIEKFETWCNASDANKVYLASLNTFGSNLEMKVNFINTLTQMGVYKE